MPLPSRHYSIERRYALCDYTHSSITMLKSTFARIVPILLQWWIYALWKYAVIILMNWFAPFEISVGSPASLCKRPVQMYFAVLEQLFYRRRTLNVMIYFCNNAAGAAHLCIIMISFFVYPCRGRQGVGVFDFILASIDKAYALSPNNFQFCIRRNWAKRGPWPF